MTRLSVYRKLNLQILVLALLIPIGLIVFGSIKSFAESYKESQNQPSSSVFPNITDENSGDKTTKAPSKLWITVDENELKHIQKITQDKGESFNLETVEKSRGLSIVEADESQILELSRNMHQEFHKCGGFIAHETLEAARLSIDEASQADSTEQLVEYTINNQTNVNSMLVETRESQIRETITRLSTDFPNRRYNQPSGLDSANWIKNKWTELAAGRSDITVEFFNHPNLSPQPSIVLTVQGTTFPNEVVVLGGHQDSINASGATVNAPGADDDASGIASLTEAIRVMAAKNFRPQRTVKFMAYAAEEVGLWGSNAIAADFQARGVNVVGVLQLDMTNYKSPSSTVDIAMVTDLTNAAQNQFVRDLIAVYQPTLTVGNTTCGYGCSDHASWHYKGFPASFPFEGTYSNPNIHKTTDTLAAMNGNADHAVKFTNLALSYVGELAKGTLGLTNPTPTPTPTVTPTPSVTPTPPTGRMNVALSANGGSATASSQSSSPSIAIDGYKNWATSGAWKDATPDAYPDWLQVNFNGSKTISEIAVYAVTDDYWVATDPTDTTIFSVYGITNFDVQYWNGSNWVNVSNGSITNNNKVISRITFAPITTTGIRVVVYNAQASYSRIVELEAWSGGTVNPTPTPTVNPTPTITPTPTPNVTPTVTPTPNVTPTPQTGRTNVALASNGSVATASSQLSSPGIAIDGIKNWATSGAWKDSTFGVYPDWLQVSFNGSKTISEINVYGVRDDYTNPTDPTDSTVSSVYGITNFEVQYWNGFSWQAVPGGTITNNNKVLVKVGFSAVTTDKIRVLINNAHDGYSRIVELEAWSGGTVNPTPTVTPTPNVTPTPSITPTPGVRTNVASSANGGSATASSQLSSPGIAIDGIRNWATTGAWKDSTEGNFPDWLQVDFNTGKTINEIVVYGVRDDYTNTNNPSETTTSTLYGITNFDVQYWTGSAWQTVPNGSITNNNKVVVKLTFAAITTNRIRVVVNSAQDAYSRVVELEAWNEGSTASYSSLQGTALSGSKESMLEKDTFSKAILNVLFPLWNYLTN